jgi:hypothetical protein
VDVIRAGWCPVAGFGMSGVEPSVSDVVPLYISSFCSLAMVCLPEDFDKPQSQH